LNDIQRADFYAAIGLDAREYDKYVIEKTNETAGRVFPVIIDVENPAFYDSLEICIKNNEQLRSIDASNAPTPIKFLQKLPIYLSNASQFIRLYFIKPIEVEQLQGCIR
jgi:magnesium-protoporphyrin IX monomethyl ester (oxidative) cyclase